MRTLSRLGIALACLAAAAQEEGRERFGKFRDFETRSPRIGEEAPAFALKNLEGKGVRLADFRGKKPVVLVFGSYT